MFDELFVKNTLTPTLAIVGTVFGLLGTGIGIFNLYLSWRTHWVRGRVFWQVETPPYKTPDGPCFFNDLTFINKSYFPVTIREAGVVVKPTFLARREYIPSFNTKMIRVEARDAQDFKAVIGPYKAMQRGFAVDFLIYTELEHA